MKVLEVTVAPGVLEPLHAHRYPSVLCYISAAHLKEHSPGQPTVDRGRKDDGSVIFLPIGPPHQMENLETTKPLKAIRVELKKAHGTTSPLRAHPAAHRPQRCRAVRAECAPKTLLEQLL